MSRMHVIAKIVATMLGIYLLISTVLMLLRSLIMVFLMGISGQPTPYWQVLASLLVTAGFIVAIFYFLIYRSDIIARKVVGQNNQVEPENLSVWYAVALRLTVIIAGFFFLWKTISILSMVSSYIQRFLQEGGSMWQFYGHIAYLLISLAISIYLLCGAPQFVRWQLKKTRELYKDSTTTP